jgi:hypothetical protein
VDALLNGSNGKLPFEKIDIFCLRILGEKIIKNTSILFNTSGDKEIPIDICIKPCPCPADTEKQASETLVHESKKIQELIDSNATTDELINANEELSRLICSLKFREKCCDKEIKCIDNIKVVCMETSEDFICNHKVRLTIKFKILLVVKFTDCCLGLIMLPDDAGTKFCFNDVSFPIVYCSDGIKKTLNLDSSKEFFVLTIEIPFKAFEGNLPSYIFDDPAAQSKLTIRSFKHEFDISDGPCSCDPNSSTHISLFSTADIIDIIGIKQDVWIYGTPSDC